MGVPLITKQVYVDFQDYNALGQYGSSYYANGASTEYNYETDGSFRLKKLETFGSEGVEPIQKIEYLEFDLAGNIKEMQVTTNTDTTYTVNHSFDYDQVNRLEIAVATSSDQDREYNQSYTYDLAGNMTKRTGTAGFEVLSWESGANKPKIRPSSVAFDREVAGVADRNITYNQENKPTQIIYNSGTTNLYYDGAGDRVKKVKGSDTVIYIGKIYEIRNDQPVSHIFANGKRIVTITGTNEYYTHTDHLGSSTIVTDASGNIVEETGYLPFGATLFRNSNNGGWESTYRFTGQEFDEEYHLYNYNARLYDPIMARFITPDPIVPNPYNPQSLNRYAYCYNNPLSYIDPSGHYAGLYGENDYNPWSSVDWWNGVSYNYAIHNPGLFGLLAGPGIFGIEQSRKMNQDVWTESTGNVTVGPDNWGNEYNSGMTSYADFFNYGGEYGSGINDILKRQAKAEKYWTMDAFRGSRIAASTGIGVKGKIGPLIEYGIETVDHIGYHITPKGIEPYDNQKVGFNLRVLIFVYDTASGVSIRWRDYSLNEGFQVSKEVTIPFNPYSMQGLNLKGSFDIMRLFNWYVEW